MKTILQTRALNHSHSTEHRMSLFSVTEVSRCFTVPFFTWPHLHWPERYTQAHLKSWDHSDLHTLYEQIRCDGHILISESIKTACLYAINCSHTFLIGKQICNHKFIVPKYYSISNMATALHLYISSPTSFRIIRLTTSCVSLTL